MAFIECVWLCRMFITKHLPEAADKSLTGHRTPRLTDVFVGGLNIAKVGWLVIVYLPSVFLSFWSPLVIKHCHYLLSAYNLKSTFFSTHSPVVSKSREVIISITPWNNYIFNENLRVIESELDYPCGRLGKGLLVLRLAFLFLEREKQHHQLPVTVILPLVMDITHPWKYSR